MIPTFFIWLAATMTCTCVSYLVARLIEGIFKFEFNDDTMPRAFWVGVCAVVFGIAGGIYCGVNELDYWLPIPELVSKGVVFPLEVIGAILFGTGATYGAAKVVTRIGSIVHTIGTAIGNASEGIKSYVGGIKARKQIKAAKEREARESAWREFEQKFSELSSLCTNLSYQTELSGEAKKHLKVIVDTLKDIRQVIVEDGNKKAVVPTLMSDYINPAVQYLRVYERLSKRSVESAQPAVQEMEQKTLPLMANKIGQIYDQIHVTDVAQLATANSVFELAKKIDFSAAAEAEAPAELHI